LEFGNLLANAKGDYLALLKSTAASLKAYMDSCDENTANDAKCVYDTLWAELQGWSADIKALESGFTEYTKRGAAADSALAAAAKKTAGLETAFDDAKKAAAGAITAFDTASGKVNAELGAKRTAAVAAVVAYSGVTKDNDGKDVLGVLPQYNKDIADLLKAEAAAKGTYEKTTRDCKVAQYDLYHAALKKSEGARAEALVAIGKLLEAEAAAAPARGAPGARCEKALSNGTFRPARGASTCTAADPAKPACCGAARIPIPGAEAGAGWMTVETCGTADQENYSYTPPRAPLATTAPAPTAYPFTCIQGARKLAAAASALAAAVYMLA